MQNNSPYGRNAQVNDLTEEDVAILMETSIPECTHTTYQVETCPYCVYTLYKHEMEIVIQQRDFYKKELEKVVPDWIGEDITDVQACLRDCNAEFAIRLLRARKALDSNGLDILPK